MIGIEAVRDAGFLADQQHPFAVRELHQNGRRSDIDVGAGIVRATGFDASRIAGHVEHVVFGELPATTGFSRFPY